ncbi:hypothetical protein, conserved [Trypanosoma vivax Y486]|uniref:Uncharacterized protein n=1 Tax=Trypanosoma vivax (strain Y486) TaxID=1055687 RepID=F9WQG1_TRYVY|nr:hypothetical protein, conserved [Trypanosoma vivax Y486]|eukprot:CCD19789.1 hypothetical protein, conserved [Trypanosoma vivax Y486]
MYVCACVYSACFFFIALGAHCASQSGEQDKSQEQMWSFSSLFRGGAAGSLLGSLRKLRSDFEMWRDRRDDRVAREIYDHHNKHKFPLIHANSRACPRSVLVVPPMSTRDSLQRQARHGAAADVVMIDLTLSSTNDETKARERVLEFLRERSERRDADDLGGDSLRFLLRVHSPEFDASRAFLDLELVGLLGTLIEGAVLPSVTTNTFSLVREYVHPDHQLWAEFDTPLSVLQAREVCHQGHYSCAVLNTHALAEGLQLTGNTTYTKASTRDDDGVCGTGVAQKELAYPPLLHHCNSQVLLAARAHGMHVLESAFTDASDTLGFRRDVRRCRAFGFDGKFTTQSAQVAFCHEAFVPTAEEVLWATEVQRQYVDKFSGSEYGEFGRVCGVSERARWQRAAFILGRHNEGATPSAHEES